MCIIPLRFPGKPASSSIFISHPPDCLHFSSDVSAPYCVSLLILKTGEPLTWSSGACPLVCWWPDVCQVSPASGRAVSVVWQCHRCQVMQGRRGTQGMWCDVTRVTTDKLSWGAALSPGGVSAVWHWRAGKKPPKSWKEDTGELERRHWRAGKKQLIVEGKMQVLFFTISLHSSVWGNLMQQVASLPMAVGLDDFCDPSPSSSVRDSRCDSSYCVTFSLGEFTPSPRSLTQPGEWLTASGRMGHLPLVCHRAAWVTAWAAMSSVAPRAAQPRAPAELMSLQHCQPHCLALNRRLLCQIVLQHFGFLLNLLGKDSNFPWPSPPEIASKQG